MSYLPDFGLIIGGLGAEEGHGCLLLAHLLAAHAAPLCLPDLGARHLDIAGAAPSAGKRGDGLGDAARVLEHVDNRGEVTLITQGLGDKEQGGDQAEEEAERAHGEAGVTDALGRVTGIITI